MTEPTVTISRARYETLIRQAFSAMESINALMSALKAELPPAADPRPADADGPAVFGSGSRKKTA